jgi:hypothetical protein
MKLKSIIFISLFVISSGSAQVIAVENVRINQAYPLIEHPLIIVSSQVPCSRLFALSKTGKIKNLENCKFTYIPLKLGLDTIFIFDIRKNDTSLIDRRIFRILTWPKQNATFGNIKSGSLKRGIILAQMGPMVYAEGFDIDATIPILSFGFKIIRNQKLICDIINIGSKFDEHSRVEIQKIKSGDRILFTDIQIKMPGEEANTKLEDLEIKVE